MVALIQHTKAHLILKHERMPRLALGYFRRCPVDSSSEYVVWYGHLKLLFQGALSGAATADIFEAVSSG